MSDELTPAQMATIQKWLGEKRKNLNCPVCGNYNSLGIQANLVATPIFANGGISIGGTSYPSVMLICGNCSYTQLFNAVVMGLVK
jgi:predicted nucleic-acid-binding Zn-ribbon protein